MVHRFNTIWDSLVKVLALVALMFQEIKMVCIGVTFLIIVDQLTGVWKACKTSTFKWSDFNKVYAKLILYLFCIIACFVYEELILETSVHYFTKGVGAVIGFQELSSIYLNVSVITGTNFLNDYIKKKFK